MKRIGLRVVSLACFALCVAFAADDVPGWLRTAAGASAERQVAPAVVLLNERRVAVDGSGRAVTNVRYAVRILNREGRSAATASSIYITASGKVKEFRAWMLPPSGKEIHYGKDRIADVAMVNDDIYNEVRMRVLSAGADAQDGAVFGYETVEEDRTVFTQFEWNFQFRWPTLVSRYSLTLPEGWTAQSVTYNHAKVEPAVSAQTYTWELKDLPYLPTEAYSPKPDALVPRLAISYTPAPGDKSALRSMTDWTAVSRWLSELSDSQAEVTDALAARAAALTQGATTEIAKIRAIGKFAQSIHYVSIQTGIGRGGGYKPHAANQVLEKQYGDCKDKANLTRTLLKAVGIPAYMVAIYSGERTYVRPDWPSPQQFNHSVVAIKVGDSTEAAAVVMHPQLGRLLIFDPTDPDTPPGELPSSEQGSYALIVAGEKGALLKMPLSPASANRTERNLVVKLSDRGAGEIEAEESYYGYRAVAVRRSTQAMTPPELKASLERRLARSLGVVKVATAAPIDAPAENRFGLRLAYGTEHFGQLMQSRLLVFRPGIALAHGGYFLPATARRLPIELRADAGRHSVRVKLPAGFHVDELPGPVHLASRYGKYDASWKSIDGEVVMEESLEVQSITAPASEYAAVRNFFEQVYGSEQMAVVLVK